jgi:hypothetical protein
MRFYGVRCDSCLREAYAPDSGRFGQPELPEGWVALHLERGGAPKISPQQALIEALGTWMVQAQQASAEGDEDTVKRLMGELLAMTSGITRPGVDDVAAAAAQRDLNICPSCAELHTIITLRGAPLIGPARTAPPAEAPRA